MEAYEEKKGFTIRMSKTQLAHNAKIEGGFLPALAGLIPFLRGTVFPALEVGALSGLARSRVQKSNWKRFVLKQMGKGCTKDQQAVKYWKM